MPSLLVGAAGVADGEAAGRGRRASGSARIRKGRLGRTGTDASGRVIVFVETCTRAGGVCGLERARQERKRYANKGLWYVIRWMRSPRAAVQNALKRLADPDSGTKIAFVIVIQSKRPNPFESPSKVRYACTRFAFFNHRAA